MTVRQFDYLLGSTKQETTETKTTVAAPGGGIGIRIIVDTDALGPGNRAAMQAGLRRLEQALQEESWPMA